MQALIEIEERYMLHFVRYSILVHCNCSTKILNLAMGCSSVKAYAEYLLSDYGTRKEIIELVSCAKPIYSLWKPTAVCLIPPRKKPKFLNPLLHSIRLLKNREARAKKAKEKRALAKKPISV